MAEKNESVWLRAAAVRVRLVEERLVGGKREGTREWMAMRGVAKATEEEEEEGRVNE